jgi:hypothetical protein
MIFVFRLQKLSARSLTPTSTPAHEARAGDPGSAAEEYAASSTGIRDDAGNSVS